MGMYIVMNRLALNRTFNVHVFYFLIAIKLNKKHKLMKKKEKIPKIKLKFSKGDKGKGISGYNTSCTSFARIIQQYAICHSFPVDD